MMEPWQVGAISGAIIGGLGGGIAVLIWGLTRPSRKCPDCGEALPRIRKPANRQQALWGGTTCPKCGCEMDRHGKKINH
jgi:hypothetical protein